LSTSSLGFQWAPSHLLHRATILISWERWKIFAVSTSKGRSR
jgi:hypothetical protein